MLQEEKKGNYAPLLVGAVAVLVLLGGIFLLTRYTQSARQVEQRLPWDATEQAYAKQIRFLEPKMSRAANFLNQEDRKSTRLNSSHIQKSRMPSSA